MVNSNILANQNKVLKINAVFYSDYKNITIIQEMKFKTNIAIFLSTNLNEIVKKVEKEMIELEVRGSLRK